MTVEDEPAAERPALPELEVLTPALARWLDALKTRQEVVRPFLAVLKDVTERAGPGRDLPELLVDRRRLADALRAVVESWPDLEAEVLAELSSGFLALRQVDAVLDPADREDVHRFLDVVLGLVARSHDAHRLLSRMERSLVDVLTEEDGGQRRAVIEAARERREAELAVVDEWKTLIDGILGRPPAVVIADAGHELLLVELDTVDAALTAWMLASRDSGVVFSAFNTLVVSANVDALDEQGVVDGAVLRQRFDVDLPPLADRIQVASTALTTTLRALDVALRRLVEVAREQVLTARDRSDVRGVLLGALEMSDEHVELGSGLADDLLSVATGEGSDLPEVRLAIEASLEAFRRQGEILQGWRPWIEASGLLAD